jgi:hypothetical protein
MKLELISVVHGDYAAFRVFGSDYTLPYQGFESTKPEHSNVNQVAMKKRK